MDTPLTRLYLCKDGFSGKGLKNTSTCFHKCSSIKSHIKINVHIHVRILNTNAYGRKGKRGGDCEAVKENYNDDYSSTPKSTLTRNKELCVCVCVCTCMSVCRRACMLVWTGSQICESSMEE